MNEIIMNYTSKTQELKTAHEGDAGFDLRLVESVTIKPHERKMASTDVRVAIPYGYVGLLVPRSGIASSTGVQLANSVGVIDAGYRGIIGVPLLNTGNKPIMIPANVRICQLLIVPIAHVQPVKVEELDETERGSDGFGSTGVE